ncbi:MAG TPA: phosphatase PAP2-related protein [Thermoanaerobaculia bacterium]|nr:phosphatase PAP2-related protein [Thermoanaerobaculia bacterium]
MSVPLWVLRAGLVAASLVAWFWTQSALGKRAAPEGKIGDTILDLTAPLNRALHERPRVAHGLLIFTSALIDFLGLFLVVQAIFGPSVRPFVGLLVLFGLRQICQGLCSLPAPAGMIWRHPGFPSLFVTYGTANDLFFSGHTAIAVYACLELAHWGGPAAAVAGIALALIEVSAVLILRAHYTMDVFAGIVTALWVWSIAFALGNRLDALLAGLAAHP